MEYAQTISVETNYGHDHWGSDKYIHTHIHSYIKRTSLLLKSQFSDNCLIQPLVQVNLLLKVGYFVTPDEVLLYI